MPRSPSRFLRLALSFNLVFATLCALIVLLVGPDLIGQSLGPFPGWFMAGLGIGLLGFAALIGFALCRLRIATALLISAMDALWVISTLPLVVLPGFLTSEGKVVVLAVAGVVALACMLQVAGIRRLLQDPDGEQGLLRHCVRLTSGAAPDRLWSIIRDLGSISRYSTSLKSSRLEGGTQAAAGVVRVCTNPKDQSWSEEVVSIDDEERSIVLRFRTEAKDFPFPFAEMTGGWQVSKVEGGSATDIWWKVRPKQRYLGWLLFALATIPLDRDIRRLVAAMEAGGPDTARINAVGLPALSYC